MGNENEFTRNEAGERVYDEALVAENEALAMQDSGSKSLAYLFMDLNTLSYNHRADVAEGKFGAEQLAEVLPYPNKVAVVYMTGAQLLEALEAASQALPCARS